MTNQQNNNELIFKTPEDILRWHHAQTTAMLQELRSKAKIYVDINKISLSDDPQSKYVFVEAVSLTAIDQLLQQQKEQTMTDTDNPRLQCEKCGKWRRLITNGEQIMFPYSEDMKGFKGDRDYDCLCVPCQKAFEQVKAALKDSDKENGNG